MTPERRIVYEIFKLLDTHIQKHRPKPTLLYVLSVKPQLSTELKREVLERAMKETTKTSVDDLLASLSTTYEESINRVRAAISDEELTAEQSKEQDEAEAQERPSELNKGPNEKIQKRFTNCWARIPGVLGATSWNKGILFK